ncbi:MAG: R3H domain-containing nucleic acid-binding protein [Candidatus Paceibacterota bacterium]
MENEQIKNLINDLLNKMTISVDSIEFLEDGFGGKTRILIHTRDSRLLIGKGGENLFSLSHIINKIIHKGQGVQDDPEKEEKRFIIDVNNYQNNLVQELKVKTMILADRARSFRKDIELEPMSSYERMIIHTFFENDSTIKTQSKGEGRDRRVVLCYNEEFNDLERI